ncbi:MAG TPA: rRNA maturation RNase YbeY [Pirellulales bacterium]|nr:rRNA maturation RNase YbeY [Pirellulales bacterium]
MLQIAVSNQHPSLKIDTRSLRRAIKDVFAGEGIDSGEISLAVVDDPTIHDLNRRWLDHDEPTDVLSFVLERSDSSVDGEIIVSADTARARAGEFGWSAEAELTLYVIHGALHLVGYDDKEPAARAEMRQREQFYLGRLGWGERGREQEETG